MDFKKYISDKFLYIVSLFFIELILFLVLNLLAINSDGIIFICVSVFVSFAIPIILEFINKRSYYNKVIEKCDELDKKTLLLELIEEPDFLEGKIFYEILGQTNKSMNDNIAEYKRQTSEYMEYINLWIHEIKTPITASKLISKNNKYSNVLEELDKIEKYVEQVLYYSKSFTMNYDFIVKRVQLDDIVNEAVKDNAKLLISNKIKINKDDMPYTVHTDAKWLKFILNQIIINSTQFMDKDEKILKFESKQTDDLMILTIKDNGMGIDKKDINKVFEKGFVGQNGRLQGKSTGFGLYICKKLCNSMNINLSIESEKNEYTQVKLEFVK